MTSSLPVFDTTVQETNAWLKTIARELEPCDRHQAYLGARATLHALRDRLAPNPAMNFAAQLPMLLRGLADLMDHDLLAKAPRQLPLPLRALWPQTLATL